MAFRWKVRLRNTDGDLLNELVDDGDFASLYIQRTVSGRGYFQLQLMSGDARRALFDLDLICEFWRSNAAWGLDWYREFTGIYRTKDRQHPESDLDVFIPYGFSPDEFLWRRIVAFYAGTAGASKSDYADDVMKEYVYENLGAGALQSLGRYEDGVLSVLSVQADAGDGPNWAGSRAWQDLSKVIDDIHKASGVDWAIVQTGDNAFQFQTYYPQMGTDRTTQGLSGGLNGAGEVPVVFSLGAGTMRAPGLTLNRSNEVNRVYALGAGQQGDRDIGFAEDTGLQADSDWNLREGTVQSNQESGTALDDTAARKLAELAPKEELRFQVVQQPSHHYGTHYFLGDLVTAVYEDSFDFKIAGVSFTVGAGQDAVEKFAVVLEEV